jgi:HSP20 family protein
MAKTGTQVAPVRTFRAFTGSDPIRELFDLQRGINRLFEDTVGTSASNAAPALSSWTPAVDVYEDENGFLIKCELPEISKEDVKVNLDNNVLSISGERKLEHEEKRDGYQRVERTYGQFYRSFTLPPNVNVEGINAEYRDGMLRLALPKREEAKPKQIQVKIG